MLELGGTKTNRADNNALKMMRSIVDIPDREFEAIHIYDLDKRVITVFKKSTGKFIKTCQLTIRWRLLIIFLIEALKAMFAFSMLIM